VPSTAKTSIIGMTGSGCHATAPPASHDQAIS
jgi:hypothetical protein